MGSAYAHAGGPRRRVHSNRWYCLTLSVSDHTHHTITYLVWYGIASSSLAGILATTIVIERGQRQVAASPAVPAHPELVDVEHGDQIRGIFRRCRSAIELGLAYTWGDELHRSIAQAHYPDLLRQVEEWNEIASQPRTRTQELRIRIRLDALSLGAQFNVPAIEEGFLAYTQTRALQGQLPISMERERWLCRQVQGCSPS
jgi:hypothetical protein